MKKLPNGIKRNLARQNGNKEWQFDNLRKVILNEIEILEAGQNISSDYELSSNSTTVATAAFLTTMKQPVLPPPTEQRPPSEHAFSVRVNIIQIIATSWKIRERDTPLYVMKGYASNASIVIQYLNLGRQRAGAKCATESIIPVFVKI